MLDDDARFGACRWIVEGSGVEFWVVVDDALCGFLLPEETARKEPLATRDAAVSGERCTLPVVLDFGDASLGDAHGIQVGDVLVSSTPLAAEFLLTHPDGKRLANARLHRAGQQFAIQVRPLAPERKK